MDLRYGRRHRKRIERLIAKHGLPAGVQATYQPELDEPIVLTSTDADTAVGGQFQMLTRTLPNVESFIANNGVVKLRRFCPLLGRRCVGDKCQWYVVRGTTGDCSIRWSAEAALAGMHSRP